MKIDDFKVTVTFETALTASTHSVIFTDANVAYAVRDKIIQVLENAIAKEHINRKEQQ